MAAQRFRGPVLPDGEARDLYVVDGRVTYEPQAAAETVAEGWIVPGLVDAHCHVGLDANGAVDERRPEEQAVTDRDAGALLLRDCGSAADTSVDPRPRGPAPADPGGPPPRPDQALHPQLRPRGRARGARGVRRPGGQRGDGWVKLVGDWIERDSGDLAPVVARARHFARGDRDRPRERRQGHRARASARTALPGLIEAGIDCIEHGTGLSADLDRRDGRAGHRAGPDRAAAEQLPRLRRRRRARSSRRTPSTCSTCTPAAARRSMSAYEAGVAIYAGTDAGGVLGARQHRRRGPRAGRLRVLARRTPWAPRPGAPARGSGSTRLLSRGQHGRLRRLRRATRSTT